jgi:hypothetical protein
VTVAAAGAAVALAMGMLTAPPSLAHSFTKTDGNDTAGRLDLSSVSVAHTRGAIVYTFTTRSTWTNASLGTRSFFLVGIDKDGDRDHERCAFIFFDTRLRGALTNCGTRFLDPLTASHPSPKVAKIEISDVGDFGRAYWWYGASRWFGGAPCGSGCEDFVPNRFPDILHDLTNPVVTMPEPSMVRVWEVGTTTDLTFPFAVTDAHSGVGGWAVERRPAFGPAEWTPVLTGTGSGSLSPTIVGTPPGRFKFRVVAVDRQGNQGIGDNRYVHVPSDVTPSGPGSFSDTGAVETPDADAWGGGYVPLDAGESYTVVVPALQDGCLVELVGPGSGDWVVDVSISGTLRSIAAVDIEDGPRRTLFSWCASTVGETTFTFTVASGTGFGVDAVLA